MARDSATGEIQEAPGGLIAAFLTAAQCHLNLMVAIAGVDDACRTEPSRV